MKLTGKAREHFYNWYKDNDHISKFNKIRNLTILHFISQSETCQNALIIEFFDSVGIYISTNPSTCYTEFDFHLDLSNNKEFSSVYNKDTGVLFYNCKSRTQATNEAIIKANEIFNLNNK